MPEQGYRRIKIRMSQQIIDVPIPVAIARVEGGTAEYVDEPDNKPVIETKSEGADKVETAALLPVTECAVKPAAQARQSTRSALQPGRQV